MNEFDRPLRSLDDAKAFFQAMGCSGFHMHRESLERHDEYRAMQISSEVERRWRFDAIARMSSALRGPSLDDAIGNQLWWVHSQLVDVVEQLHEEAAVEQGLAASELVASMVRGDDCLLVVESILGRSPLAARRGLVCCAFDVGRGDLARRLLSLVDDLLERRKKPGPKPSRWQAARTRCREIGRMLNLRP